MKTSAMHGESGYERVANDAYWTPEWCTAALLESERFPPWVWEPACGQGHICRVMDTFLISNHGSDLIFHGYGQGGEDFLRRTSMWTWCRSIITNPPYKLAEAFIRKALDLTEPHQGRVAMLLRNEYDCAAGRRDLFEHPAFLKKLVLTKRPKWSAEDKASPRHNFAWFVWCWKKPPGAPPVMEWGP